MTEFYRDSELEAASDFEGKRTKFSGASDDDKSDVITGGKYEGYFIENKATKQKSYSINFEYFKKQERYARIQGKKFFMRIDNTKEEPLIVIRQSEFQRLFE